MTDDDAWRIAVLEDATALVGRRVLSAQKLVHHLYAAGATRRDSRIRYAVTNAKELEETLAALQRAAAILRHDVGDDGGKYSSSLRVLSHRTVSCAHAETLRRLVFGNGAIAFTRRG